MLLLISFEYVRIWSQFNEFEWSQKVLFEASANNFNHKEICYC